MLHHSTKTRVFERLLASLGRAPEGGRELDIVVSFVLGDTSSEAGRMIQLLVEEGYPWDVISELLDEELPAYTSSLDAALPGENVVLAAYAKKRRQWVAVHRDRDGEQISAWAASECLARRLAGLRALSPLGTGAGTGGSAGARTARPQPRPQPRPQTYPQTHPGPRPQAQPGAPRPHPAAPRPEPELKPRADEEWRILF